MRGDPTLLGWLTVAFYVAVAVLAWRAAGRGRSSPWFWRGTAVFAVCLGVNEQLDLQVVLMERARDVLYGAGLLPAGREVMQVVLAAAAIVSVPVIAFGAVFMARRVVGWGRLACLGWLLISLYVVGRAAFFHRLWEVGLSFLVHESIMAPLELMGLVVIGGAAIMASRSEDGSHPRDSAPGARPAHG